MEDAGQPPRERRKMTFAERQRLNEEQARANRVQPAREGKRATSGKKRRLKARPRRRAKPLLPPPLAYPCRIYFWQQEEGGPIRIGHASRNNDQVLKAMRGTGDGRAHRMAVIPDADTEREAAIHQQFAHLKIQPGASLFHHPAEELLAFIELHAQEWERPVKEKPPKPEKLAAKPKRRLVERTCGECGEPFQTHSDFRYCPGCREVIKSRMFAAGQIRPIPGQAAIKPENRGAEWDERGDPSPWRENAVRALEDG